ncbi:hypothetical protein [Actinopolymorpha pittospori]|uniref:Glycosyl transferases group 1 n=1 Tax=Actinopolymorpha pittospori TaxID=648752 RepID=A0A927R9Y5_9ACTN|nr:hypothetical protein [Actinopolymorpha pittospori]MBE1608372.1 hypothetical protein [Actinopolymorpha pittospori]
MIEHGNGFNRVTRRGVLLGAVGAAALAATAGNASASPLRPSAGRPRVLVATNEPWGTYHVSPLLAEAQRRGYQLTQLVPDRSQIKPGDPVPVATPEEAPAGDVLVVNGADDWPADCAKRFSRLPLVASSLAYLQPVEAPRARELRPRLRTITSSSPAEGRSFAKYLGQHRRIQIVGSPQTDGLPERSPQPDTVLVLTSVTYPDETGGAAPGTQLLLDAAARLQAAGKRILVGLHPRENPALWDQYEISPVPSVQASATAEAAVGIPGTVFPLVVAVGTPVVGCVDPALEVPDYLLDVCSSTIDTADAAVAAIQAAQLPDAHTIADAVGPVGGSAARLLDAWGQAARRGK